MAGNRRIVLAERPRYTFPTTNCFKLGSSEIPEPAEGQVLIRTQWLGIEPYLLGKVKRASGQAPVQLGDAMEGPAVGVVEASRNPELQVGDRVTGLWAWQERALSDSNHVRKLPAELKQASHALGALGYSGFGAYLALTHLGDAQPGQTVVTGAASGGMGQMVGQIARIKGVRAVGVAGSAEKCRLATENFGYEMCLDRHLRSALPAELKKACPQGIDVYIETVGGRVYDAALPLLRLRARMVVAGLMTMYTANSLPDGPDRTMVLLNEINLKRLQVLGLVVFDHMKARYSDFKRDMLGWLDSGEVKPLEHVFEGLENAPSALQAMFEGKNLGKTVVKVSD